MLPLAIATSNSRTHGHVAGGGEREEDGRREREVASGGWERGMCVCVCV